VTQFYVSRPNPFRTHVAVRYSPAAPGRASVQVCDPAGRVVRTLADGVMRPGRYSLSWSGTDDRGSELARGVYFCRFRASDYQATKKLLLQNRRWTLPIFLSDVKARQDKMVEFTREL
jgi:hypothetical protein